jgi:hypothetical protein
MLFLVNVQSPQRVPRALRRLFINRWVEISRSMVTHGISARHARVLPGHPRLYGGQDVDGPEKPGHDEK